jgi:hypothetical protein
MYDDLVTQVTRKNPDLGVFDLEEKIGEAWDVKNILGNRYLSFPPPPLPPSVLVPSPSSLVP